MKFRFTLSILLLLLIYTCDRQIVAPVRDNPFDSGNAQYSTDLFNIQTQNLSEHILISWEYTHAVPTLDSYVLYRVDALGTNTSLYNGVGTSFEDPDVEWNSTYNYYVTGMLNNAESTHPELSTLPEVIRRLYVGSNSEYTKIADALNVLQDGDIVYVMSGVYVENIDFGDKEIQLICDGIAGSCEIQGDNSGPVISIGINQRNTAVLDGFKIQGNSSNVSGSAIMINTKSKPLIKNCIFQNNTTIRDGGAIFCDEQSAPTIENCTFIHNEADGNGGAIYCDESDAIITNCMFEENIADYGGAIYIGEDASPEIELSTFEANESNDNGGAIYIDDTKGVSFKQSLFTNNIADEGGAIYIKDCSTNSLSKYIEIAHCILRKNDASDNGGAVFSIESSLKIEYSTFNDNSAPNGRGGALYAKQENKAVITNSIFWNNNADEFPEIDADNMLNTSLSVEYSDIENAAGCNLCSSGSNYNLGEDPLFEDEDDGDLQLENESPCINADENSSQMGAYGEGISQIGASGGAE